MSKFHRTVPHYTEQQWAAFKHRNGYSPVNKPIAPAPAPLEAPLPETALVEAATETPPETSPSACEPPTP